jgi:protein gp37
MNKTEIEWMRGGYAWNPVTGCHGECPYCYARRTANESETNHNPVAERQTEHGRIAELHEPIEGAPFPRGFVPTFHRYRLGEPAAMKKPSNIFVCSMADLFGPWVPDEWIYEVLDACIAAPQHTYFFLTKYPERYHDINEGGKKNSYPEFMRHQAANEGKKPPTSQPFQRINAWIGTTVNTNGTADRRRVEMMDSIGWSSQKYLSIEPIQSEIPLVMSYYTECEWIIVGAETGNRAHKIQPEREWVESIKDNCRHVGKALFMKESLRDIMGDSFVQEYPKCGKESLNQESWASDFHFFGRWTDAGDWHFRMDVSQHEAYEAFVLRHDFKEHLLESDAVVYATKTVPPNGELPGESALFTRKELCAKAMPLRRCLEIAQEDFMEQSREA